MLGSHRVITVCLFALAVAWGMQRPAAGQSAMEVRSSHSSGGQIAGQSVAGQPAVSPWDLPPGTALWAMPPQSAHRVIRTPQILSHEELKAQSHRGKLTPPVATIDRAAVEKVWRQPYAYGYFGAQPQRHWQRHFGWNRAYTQWTLK